MSTLRTLLSVFRPTPHRCRANAWASVYAQVYDVEPGADDHDGE